MNSKYFKVRSRYIYDRDSHGRWVTIYFFFLSHYRYVTILLRRYYLVSVHLNMCTAIEKYSHQNMWVYPKLAWESEHENWNRKEIFGHGWIGRANFLFADERRGTCVDVHVYFPPFGPLSLCPEQPTNLWSGGLSTTFSHQKMTVHRMHNIGEQCIAAENLDKRIWWNVDTYRYHECPIFTSGRHNAAFPTILRRMREIGPP